MDYYCYSYSGVVMMLAAPRIENVVVAVAVIVVGLVAVERRML